MWLTFPFNIKSVRKANFPHQLIALPLISIEPRRVCSRWIYLDLQAQETSPSDNFLTQLGESIQLWFHSALAFYNHCKCLFPTWNCSCWVLANRAICFEDVFPSTVKWRHFSERCPLNFKGCWSDNILGPHIRIIQCVAVATLRPGFISNPVASDKFARLLCEQSFLSDKLLTKRPMNSPLTNWAPYTD